MTRLGFASSLGLTLVSSSLACGSPASPVIAAAPPAPARLSPPPDGGRAAPADAGLPAPVLGSCRAVTVGALANDLLAAADGASAILTNGQTYALIAADGMFVRTFAGDADAPRKAALFAHGARAVIETEADPMGSDVALLDVASDRVLAHFTTHGQDTWRVDDAQTKLFVSGIEVVSAPASGDSMGMPVVASTERFDHAEVDLQTGAVQKIRTREGTSDVPNRDVAIAAAGDTFVSAGELRLTLFSATPFRVVKTFSLKASLGGVDSSFSLVPHLVRLSDGDTVEASLPTFGGQMDGSESGAPEKENVWFVSLRARKLLFHGTSDAIPAELRALLPPASATEPDDAQAKANAKFAAQLAPLLRMKDGLYVPKSVCTTR